MADLVFGLPPYAGGPVHLVFGKEPTPPEIPPVSVVGTVSLGGVSVSGAVAVSDPPAPSAVVGTVSLGGPVVTGSALYLNRNPRHASGSAAAAHQAGQQAQAVNGALWGLSEHTVAQRSPAWQPAAPEARTATPGWEAAARRVGETQAPWQQAAPVGTSAAPEHQRAATVADQVRAVWQAAEARAQQAQMAHQRANAVLDQFTANWQPAQGRHRSTVSRAGRGKAQVRHLLALWQVAQRPPGGKEVWPPVGPVVPPPRVPSTNLVFACPPWAGGAVHLVFGHVCAPVYPPEVRVVPVREVYMTVNNFSLVRIDNSYVVPATRLSLSLDVDSWTWSASFSVPGHALSQLVRDTYGEPVVLQATVNGTPIQFAVEKIGRDRSFGNSQLRVTGRGLAAELDAPYAPTMSFSNTAPRTARQLLDDILTLNGEPIGWTVGVDAFTDWLVPAGVFSHTGTYISALNAVVGAVGGYIQPHNTLREFDVRLRYPTPAWEWSAAMPDVVLPSSVVTVEGLEWQDKPAYNRVFVSGQEGGIVGRYTRAGTAGDLLAPAIVDPLITHTDAARQRGRAVISDTGAVATVTLRLPVLAETGIIKPGNMIRYTDGATVRTGLSRAVSVDVGLPTIYQTLQVETHDD